jgi:hypothetical protein
LLVIFVTRLTQLPIVLAKSLLYVSMNFASEKSLSFVPSGPCVARNQRSASRPNAPT